MGVKFGTCHHNGGTNKVSTRSRMCIQCTPPPQSQNHIDGENDSNESKVMQEFYGEGLGIGPTKASPPSKGCYVKVKNQDLFYLVVNLTL